MKDKENVHSGHRERMMTKFLANPDSFLDHELLETLLFYAVPRVDTNPIAHKLLKRFGTLEKVVCADKAELMTVDGVGEKTANLIMLTGKIQSLIAAQGQKKIKLSNFQKARELICEAFRLENTEKVAVYLLDKKHVLITKLEFTDDKKYRVSTDIPELSKALAVHKPTFVIIAHNHTSGFERPSPEDDLATKRINLLCDVHGVGLIDHIIYADGKCFSYRHSGRLEYIKHDSDINKLLEGIKES